MSEAYIFLLHYRNDATFYSGNIKDVDSHSFTTDGELEDSVNKAPRGGQKGGSLRGGNIESCTGEDADDTSTITTEGPPLLEVRCFRLGNMGHYQLEFNCLRGRFRHRRHCGGGRHGPHNVNSK